MLVKLNKFFILLILFLQVDFFSLLRNNQTFFVWNSYQKKYLAVVLIIVLYIINTVNDSIQEKKKYDYFRTPIYFGIVAMVLVFIGSIMTYSQSLGATVRVASYLLIPLLYFPLKSIFDNVQGFNFISNSIINVGIVYAVLLNLQFVMYKIAGVLFLDTGVYGLNIDMTSGGFRIAKPADFISFSLLFLCLRIYSHSENNILKNFTFVLIDFFFIIFVSQTRMYVIISALLIIILLVVRSKGLLKYFVFVYSALFAILSIFAIPSVLNSFTTGNRSESFSIRSGEIPYYFDKIFLHKWFGIGFPDQSIYGYIVNGPYSTSLAYLYNQYVSYSLDDVGLLGYVATFGIIGFLILIIYIYKFITLIRMSVDKTPIMMICLYLLISAITLSIFDIQRILYLPIILYISEYYVLNLSKENNNESFKKLPV